MAIFKCKYCGGNISPFPDNHLGVCSACGAVMTLPRNTDKQHASAHNAGNYFRRAGQFDKALAIYRKELAADSTDAESCWCSALCRFGVQYLEEDGVYRPAALRPESGNFLECSDYLAAVSLSSGAVQLQYEKEAKKIADSMKPKSQEAPAKLVKEGYMALRNSQWEAADGCFAQALETETGNAMAHLGRLLAEFRCTEPKALPACGQDIRQSAHYEETLQYANETIQKFLRSCTQQIQEKAQQDDLNQRYQQALEAMKAGQYQQAADLFAALEDYRDSRQCARDCRNQLEQQRQESVYRAGVYAMQHKKTAQAAELFQRIPGWKDADVLAAQCSQQAQAKKGVRERRLHRVKKFFIKTAAVLAALAALGIGGHFFTVKYWIPQQQYKSAEALLAAENREEAIDAFRALGSFKDSPDRVLRIQEEWYREAETLLAAGDEARAAAIFGGLRDYRDAQSRSSALWAEIIQPTRISAGGWSTVALRGDRMVSAVGSDREKQCQVGAWQDIASVSAGWAHTVGLCTDGTAVATGYNSDGRCNVDGWRDMVAVSAGQWHTVGLKSNGRVVGLGCAEDGRTDFDDWRYIIGISAGRNHTVGLLADRTAVAVGLNDKKQCNVESWNNLLAVAAGGAHTLGLTRDGKVLAVGSNDETQCNVEKWTDIVAISAGYYHSVGLKADGTVVAVGLNEYGQCDVSKWTDIVAISAGGWHTVGLKADGSVVAVGMDDYGQCDVLGWDNLFSSVGTQQAAD